MVSGTLIGSAKGKFPKVQAVREHRYVQAYCSLQLLGNGLLLTEQLSTEKYQIFKIDLCNW